MPFHHGAGKFRIQEGTISPGIVNQVLIPGYFCQVFQQNFQAPLVFPDNHTARGQKALINIILDKKIHIGNMGKRTGPFYRKSKGRTILEQGLKGIGGQGLSAK
ncbi:MAG: hypothetical protein BWY80_01471 [Firmicutes bacterium ADurb.Bin456]|nr:MAG: hypothetical protein BWY80_01471 [Firmicutes bacterium ADurb.Bin456]